MQSELKSILLKRRKAAMVEFYQNRPECFEEAMEMALSQEIPFCWRAAWMIGGDIKKNDPRIAPYASKIIELLHSFEDGHQRELLKIVLQLPLTEEQESLLFDLSVDLWEQIRKKSSVRHFAFKAMVQVAKKYPELTHEILLLTEPHYINPLSPGIKKSVFKMLEELRKYKGE